MKIANGSFLVAGGSSGLGAACVRRLASLDARVTIADVNDEGGRELADELGERVQFRHTDVTDEASVQAAMEAAATAGPLRGAINCAGVALAEKVLSRRGLHDLSRFRKVLDVNLVGTFNVLRFAAEA